MLCGMTGCVKAGEENSVSDSSAVPESAVLSAPESTASSVSEDYDTSEDTSETGIKLNYEIELADHQITLPCKVKELQDFMINISGSLGSLKLDNGGRADQFYIIYNGERVGRIALEGNCEGKSDLSDEKVVGIVITNEKGEIPVSYKGFTIGSDEQDILSALGDIDRELGNSMSYYFIEPEGSVIFRYNKERKVYEIWLRTAVR